MSAPLNDQTYDQGQQSRQQQQHNEASITIYEDGHHQYTSQPSIAGNNARVLDPSLPSSPMPTSQDTSGQFSSTSRAVPHLNITPYDHLALRKRNRADSRVTVHTIPENTTPPLRALTHPPASTAQNSVHTGQHIAIPLPTTSSDVNISGLATNAEYAGGPASVLASSAAPARRFDTLDTYPRTASSLISSEWPPRPPRPLTPIPVTPNPNDAHEFGHLHTDEELAFIPLLDDTARFYSPKPSMQAFHPPSETSHQPSLQQPSSRHLAEDHIPRVSDTLQYISFSDDALLAHIRDFVFPDSIVSVLKEALRRSVDIDFAASFADFSAYERDNFISGSLEVYDIARDATAIRSGQLDLDEFQGAAASIRYPGDGPYETVDDVVDASKVWNAIKEVNVDNQSVGRIVIVQEPSPLTLAALHLAMSPYFDMTELLSHLVSDTLNRGRSHAFMHRAFEPSASSSFSDPIRHSSTTGGDNNVSASIANDAIPITSGMPDSRLPIPACCASSTVHLRQRSFFFVFKYYTTVGDGLEPSPWQRYDKRPQHERLGDHIDIAECGSILALSLGGNHTKRVRMRPRRERVKDGFLFNTFGPWQLLNIQSFPDDQHTVRTEEDFQSKSFYNGPYAFLELLVAEYRDAGKRNQILHERITKLITPPAEFMFDHRVRDKLLFEDKHFTYIRRYFWAYNTLAVINTGIKSMVTAYVDTFTEEFWAGSHPLLWPYPRPSHGMSGDEAAYANAMAGLRRELDKVVAELNEVSKRNERTRKEIENLRDQLFSGSSIRESRRAIDQGANIRVLTTISMIFLPLTFVTSVFGITEFTIPATDWRFAVTMVLVCVPFMLLVYLLQTRAFILLFGRFTSATRRIPMRFLSAVARLRSFFTIGKGDATSSPPLADAPVENPSITPSPLPPLPPAARKRRRAMTGDDPFLVGGATGGRAHDSGLPWANTWVSSHTVSAAARETSNWWTWPWAKRGNDIGTDANAVNAEKPS